MSKNLYVGNLPWKATEQELHDLFSQYGQVNSVKIISDRETGRSRGFGFVEMEDGGDEAMQTLNGAEFGGRNIRVNEARPRQERRQAW
ncbi:RNA recognition motif domain-containing protein [Desulfovulcanus ferrireducens]|uniref:RNA recognition motif domain-containing protein n=1 Tax=Desulfovulcanus ferrireducens TaxID=2831190 RepID=UPI00207BBDDD|nr:RNA-binding protein [Desulfovulcanus ferrireducens]MBT8763170.1 RNA-binding protein [Desulfovulcanus ferrireducens]